MNDQAQDGVSREPHDSGPEDNPNWLPTGCAEHVSALQARIAELKKLLEVQQQHGDDCLFLLREARERNNKLRDQLAKCYATRPATRTADGMALRELADRILEEVKLALREEGWNVVPDDPDDEEVEEDDDSEEEG